MNWSWHKVFILVQGHWVLEAQFHKRDCWVGGNITFIAISYSLGGSVFQHLGLRGWAPVYCQSWDPTPSLKTTSLEVDRAGQCAPHFLGP